MLLRGVLIWCALLIVASINGGLREAVLVPRMGRGSAQAVSTLMLSACICGLGWLTLSWIGPRTLKHAWTIGIIWVSLTLAFEFLAGHYLFGRPWEELRADYDVRGGRIWVLVLVVTLLTPVAAFMLQRPRG
jgi:hypothetical protein